MGMYQTLREMERGGDRTSPWLHLLHCMQSEDYFPGRWLVRAAGSHKEAQEWEGVVT